MERKHINILISFFEFESGSGKCIIDGIEYPVKNGDAIIIPAGAKHNIMNTDPEAELKYTQSMALPIINRIP